MISAGRSLGVLSPGEPVHMSWAAGSEVFGLRADTGAMQASPRGVDTYRDTTAGQLGYHRVPECGRARS